MIFMIFADLNIGIARERHHTNILFHVTNQLAAAQKSWISIMISITTQNSISDKVFLVSQSLGVTQSVN